MSQRSAVRAAGALGAVAARVLQTATGLAVGATAWSLTEYATHRWVLHARPLRGRLARVPVGAVHRHHHAEPEHTIAAARAGACVAMLGVGAMAGAGLARHLPAGVARAAGLSWGAGYTVYDLVHWRLHHRPPTSDRGVRLRQRHFRHHFGAPRGNLGVTSAWADRLLGTEVGPATVTVPSRHAPAWLDALGPEFTAAAPRAARDAAQAV